MCATCIQKLHRGYCSRKIYLGQLEPRLKDVRHFYSIWKKFIGQMPISRLVDDSSADVLSGWDLVREKLDLKRVDLLEEDGTLADTDERLNQALRNALNEDNTCVDTEVEEVKESAADGENESKYDAEATITAINWSQFQVTSHVVKFLKNGDKMYRDIFVKRMKQLARGERSHKLQKPLKGCKSIICEYPFFYLVFILLSCSNQSAYLYTYL